MKTKLTIFLLAIAGACYSQQNVIGHRGIDQMFEIGINETITNQYTYTLRPAITNQDSVLYFSNGTGTFDNNKLKNPTYTFSTADLLSNSNIFNVAGYYHYGTTKDTVWDSKTVTLSNPISDATRYFKSDSIFGLWPLWETSGTTATDIINEYNGAYLGTYTLNSNSFASKPSVNMGGGRINMYTTTLRDRFPTSSGYISLWVKATTNASWTATSYLFNFQVDANNRVMVANTSTSMSFYYSGSGTTKSVLTSPLYGLGWINVGCRYNNIAGTLDLFLNGIKQKTLTGGLGSWSGAISSSLANFGAFQSGSSPFNGNISNALILKYVPSDSEIKEYVNPSGLIMFEGDSRTWQKKWPFISAANGFNNPSYTCNKMGLFNAAIGGSDINAMSARSTDDNTRLTNNNNILIVWIGVNNYNTATQDIYNGIKAYCQSQRAAGWDKIILCTEINGNPVGWSTKYLALNVLIRADHSFVDGVADLGAITELQDYTNTTYFGDGLHPTAAGYDLIATCVGNTLYSLLNP
jgi:hypothetical protein